MKTFPKDHISSFLKYKRSGLGLKQEELAKKAGVGIRFLRELEQGKESLKMDKVNQVLNGMQKKIKIYLEKNRLISGILVGFQTKNGQVLRWKIVTDEHLKEYKRTNHPSLEIERLSSSPQVNFMTIFLSGPEPSVKGYKFGSS